MKVYAHRGASEDVAEHTLAAYKKAIMDGADGVEADVRLTADGVLVCVHDRRVDRMSSGRGVVSALELAELRGLDFGAWKDTWADFEDPEEPDRDRSEVLTLERLLGLVADMRGQVELLIETKHPTRYGGLVEQRLVELLDRFGYARPERGTTGPVKVMSRAVLSLRRIRQLAPRLPAVLIIRRVPMRFRDGSLPPGVRIANLWIELVRGNPALVHRIKERGHDVYVWTVNRTKDIDLCVSIGVDAIITDRPEAALERLGRDLGPSPKPASDLLQ